MSLLSEAMESFKFKDRVTRPDGYGSVIPEWIDGAEFNAALSFDNSIEAKRAEKEGVEDLYTITTTRDVPLNFGNVIQRLADGRYFYITSNGDDKKTPLSATLNMRVVSARVLESLPMT